MTEGLSYLAGQVAVLLVVAVALGAGATYLVLSRRPEPAGEPAPEPAAPAIDPGVVTAYENRLRTALAESHQLRAALADAQTRADVDPEQLETEAVHGLKENISWHQRRLATVEAKLHEAEVVIREFEVRLDEERRQGDLLEAALHERERYITELRAALGIREDSPR